MDREHQSDKESGVNSGRWNSRLADSGLTRIDSTWELACCSSEHIYGSFLVIFLLRKVLLSISRSFAHNCVSYT